MKIIYTLVSVLLKEQNNMHNIGKVGSNIYYAVKHSSGYKIVYKRNESESEIFYTPLSFKTREEYEDWFISFYNRQKHCS